MARLSEKSLLAVAAVVDVAIHSRGAPVAAKALAERHNLPPRHLEPVLQALVHAGILKGVRGPRGGYRLARERRRITVAEIVRVVRRVETDDDPLQDGPGSPLGHLVVRPLWLDLQDEVMQHLDKITLDDLCHKANQAGIVSEGREAIDFVI